jgi:hypothetical protein
MISFLLAATETSSGAKESAFNMDQTLNFVWEQITSLTWLQAVIGISFGMVYLLYGWRIFRILVVICFALIGLFLGIMAGQKFGSELMGGVMGTIGFAILAMWLVKWCVSVLGAAAGGIVTGGLWYAVGLPEQYIWAGAIIGVVAGGMMSFILLKISVMLFTSMGGAAILAISFLALLHQYETKVLSPVTDNIHQLLFDKVWFLPMTIIIPTIIGMIVQNSLIKKSSEWDF